MRSDPLREVATTADPPSECLLCGESKDWQLVVSPARDCRYGVPGSWFYHACRSCGLVVLYPPPRSHAAAYPVTYSQHSEGNVGGPAGTPLRRLLRSSVLAALGYGPDSRWVLPTMIGRVGSTVRAVRVRATWGFLLVPPARVGGRLLDVGCGNGRFLSTMARLGWDVYGIEPDPMSARRAREVVPGTIIEGRPVDASFPSGFFDVITMNHVIEHLENPKEDLRALREWCAPHGRLGIATPNFSSLTRFVFGKKWYALEPPRHTVLFRPRSLRTLVEKCGFRVTTVATPSSREAAVSWTTSWQFRHGRRAPSGLAAAGTALSMLTAPLGLGEEIELWAEPAA